MNAVKHERFVRIATARVEALIRDFDKLGRCAAKESYEYTPEEVEKIFAEIDRQLIRLRDRFEGRDRFVLNKD